MTPELAPVPIDDVVAALAALSDELASSDALTRAIAAESGLHPVALRHSLGPWFASLDEGALRRLVASASRPPNPASRVLTLAPGNVPIVGAECLVLGLLAGGRHVLAASTRATALPIALHRHLRAVVPALDTRLELVVWRQLGPPARQALLRRASRLVAYGTAETVEWLASRAPAGTVLVPHGPSLALAWLDPAGLGDGALEEALLGLALDVARWDQRGCRSPHAVLVPGTVGTLRELAERLVGEALPRAAATLPRGRLTDAEVAAVYLDGLTSAALGHVRVGADFVLTLEDRPRVLRPSPLGRTLRLVAVDGAELLEALAPTLPAPVGTLAVAGADPNALLRDTEPLERVPLGTLQRPPFDRLHDGRHRLDELRDPVGA
jgi:hypothetical protein